MSNNNNNNNNNKQLQDLTDSSPLATGGFTMEDRVGQVNARQYRMVQDYDVGSTIKHPKPPSYSGEVKHTATGNKLSIPKIQKQVAERIPSQPVVASITDVKPEKKNDSLDIPASSEK
ncbi:hypothetical protein Tco_0544839 [Tanacetum coccineum]